MYGAFARDLWNYVGLFLSVNSSLGVAPRDQGLSVPRNLPYVKWLTAWLARQGYTNALRLVIFSTSIKAKRLETKRFHWRRDCLIWDKVLQSYLFLRFVFELTVSDRVIFFLQHRYTQAKLNIADRANKVRRISFDLCSPCVSFLSVLPVNRLLELYFNLIF